MKVSSDAKIMSMKFTSSQRIKRTVKTIIVVLVSFLLTGTLYVNFVGEQRELAIPVEDATKDNWDAESYWHSPWGKSGIHKGIDVFASQKTKVTSPINGLILSAGYSRDGGNYVYVLGPKLRVYYFAHMNTQEMKSLSLVKNSQRLGAVGNSGNAVSTPYHLHFSIFSIFPVFRNYTRAEPSGWKKMFYLDPNKSLKTK